MTAAHAVASVADRVAVPEVPAAVAVADLDGVPVATVVLPARPRAHPEPVWHPVPPHRISIGIPQPPRAATGVAPAAIVVRTADRTVDRVGVMISIDARSR
jgi:hypothetical protein